MLRYDVDQIERVGRLVAGSVGGLIQWSVLENNLDFCKRLWSGIGDG